LRRRVGYTLVLAHWAAQFCGDRRRPRVQILGPNRRY
jgi:hypothetical protein